MQTRTEKKDKKGHAFPQLIAAGEHPASARLHEVPNTGRCGRENMTPNGTGMRERRINISKEERGDSSLANLQSQPLLRLKQKTKTKVTGSNVATNYSDLLSSLLVRTQVGKVSGDSESKVGGHG